MKLKQIKNKSRYLALMFGFICILTACNEMTSDVENKDVILTTDKSFQIPIYPESKKISRFSISAGRIEGLKYEIKQKYPANGVLEFYEAELERYNWIPYIEEYYKYSDRKWQRFVDSTSGKEKYVAQLMADWITQKKTKRIRLTLNYYWEDYNSSSKIVLTKNEDLFVTVQIMPFITLKPPG